MRGAAAGHAARAHVLPNAGEILFSRSTWDKHFEVSSTQASFKAHTTVYLCGGYAKGQRGTVRLVISKGAASQVLGTWTLRPQNTIHCDSMHINAISTITVRIMNGSTTIAQGKVRIR